MLFALGTSSVAQVPAADKELSLELKRTYVEAMDLFKVKTKDALLKSRQKFREFASQLSEGVAPLARGQAYFHAGWISRDFGETATALEEYKLAARFLNIAGDKSTESIALNNVGLMLANLGQPAEGIEYYERSIAVSSEIGDKEITALTLMNLGAAAQLVGSKPKALASLEQALFLYTELDKKLEQAKALNFLGLYYASEQKDTEAVQFFLRALPLFQSAGNRLMEGMVSFNFAASSYKLGEKEKALQLFEKALAIFRSLDHKSYAMRTLMELAVIAFDKKDVSGSIKNKEEALTLARLLSDRATEAIILDSLSSDHVEIGGIKKALELNKDARDLYRALGKTPEVGYTFYRAAQVSDGSGDRRQALKDLLSAILIFRQIDKLGAVADSLQMIGGIYDSFGDRKRALESFRGALELSRTLKNKNAEARALVSLGMLSLTTGDYSSAKNYADEVGKLGREAGDKEAEALGAFLRSFVDLNTSNFTGAYQNANKAIEYVNSYGSENDKSLILMNLGIVYSSLGDFSKARAALEESLRAVNKNQKQLLAGTILFLGNTYLLQKDFDKSLEHFERALKLARQSNNRSIESTALNNIGATKAWQEKHEEAAKYYLQALEIARTTQSKPGLARALSNLGIAYAESKVINPQALIHLTEALALARVLGDPSLEAATLGGLGIYWFKNKNSELAIFYGKQAVNIIQELRRTLVTFDKQTREGYIEQYAEGYRKLADIFIEAGRIAEAEKVLAMLKEEEYFDFVRRDAKVSDELLATLSLTSDEQKAFEQYKKHAHELTVLGQEYSQLQTESLNYDVGKFPRQTRFEELEKLIENSNRVFNLFLDSLKSSFGDNDLRVSSLESGTQAILKELNEPKTVFISTISGEARLNIILTTTNIQKAYTVNVKASDLNLLVADFRRVLRDPRLDPRPAGKALFDRLFPDSLKKDLAGVSADTILWSLDGTLRYIPIAALWDGSQYLVEKYKNVLISLASRDKITKPVSDRARWSILGTGVSTEAVVTDVDGTTRRFDALNSVPDELCNVVADPEEKEVCRSIRGVGVGVINGKFLLNEKFTLSAFNRHLNRFPIIHIASHFSLNPGNENDSYLLLGGGDERKLTLSAIRQGSAKFVGVELLTLSACNTGVTGGSKSNGVEIEGFGAIAQNQGAKTVVASLWSVADHSTRDLMVSFYRQLVSDTKINKAEALRRAQLALLKGGNTSALNASSRAPAETFASSKDKPFRTDATAPFSHPYYWSSFVLMGNWK